MFYQYLHLQGVVMHSQNDLKCLLIHRICQKLWFPLWETYFCMFCMYFYYGLYGCGEEYSILFGYRVFKCSSQRTPSERFQSNCLFIILNECTCSVCMVPHCSTQTCSCCYQSCICTPGEYPGRQRHQLLILLFLSVCPIVKPNVQFI